VCAQQARALATALCNDIIAFTPGSSENPTQQSCTLALAHKWVHGRLSQACQKTIFENILDDTDVHLLSQFSCSVLALETVREAMSMVVSNELYLDDTLLHKEETNLQTWLCTFLRLLEIILLNEPYTPFAVQAQTKKELLWLYPKHMGRGMEYLQARFEQKKPPSDSLVSHKKINKKKSTTYCDDL
jgi:hypothetical protein